MTELNTAAASFPPTALVRITAEETGGGMQLTVVNLHNNAYINQQSIAIRQKTTCILTLLTPIH